MEFCLRILKSSRTLSIESAMCPMMVDAPALVLKNLINPNFWIKSKKFHDFGLYLRWTAYFIEFQLEISLLLQRENIRIY